ncbi:MAG: HEAT repeat domain-containing protein [Candidatus Firestonebacteria bacterium]
MEKQCEKIRDNIQGYFENSLSKQAYENTESHLRECPDCSWYFREYEKMDEILSKWVVPEAGGSFEDNVIISLADKSSKKSKSFIYSYLTPVFTRYTALAVLIFLALVYLFSLPTVVGQGKETGDRNLAEEGRIFALKTGQVIIAEEADLELSFNDGSLINLAKGGRLVIESFSSGKKICSLAGELKARIRKYPGQEFTIKTGHGDIMVLGTGFLVSADKNKTIVSVFEGSVAVKGVKEKAQLMRGNLTMVGGSSSFVTPVNFLDASKDPDKYVRIQAIKALLEIKGKEETRALLALLNDPEETVRAEAAFGLGLLGPGNKEAVRPLLKALKDRDKEVRKYAALSLGKLKAPEAREPLKGLAGDPEIEVRTGAALGLKRLGEKPRNFDLTALVEDLESPDTGVRCRAVKLFGVIGNEKTNIKIAEKLKDPKKEVRWYAVRALERQNDPATFPALLGALKDPENDIQRKALQAIAGLNYTGAVKEVAAMLTETSSKEIKFAALRTLGYLLMNYYGNDRAEFKGLLEKYINDHERLLKVAALFAYARAEGEKAAQKVLEVSVKDGNKIMKAAATEILKLTKKQDFIFNLRPAEIRALGKLKEKAVIPVLLAAAEDWNPSTREAALEGLGNLYDKLYLPILYEGLKDSDSRVAETAETAVKAFPN